LAAGEGNVAAGYQALLDATGSPNIAIGPIAGKKLTTGSDNIYIAYPGAVESGTIRIGTAASQNAVFLAGIGGKTIGGPTMAVVVNEKGRLGVAPAPLAPQTQARPSPGSVAGWRNSKPPSSGFGRRLEQAAKRGVAFTVWTRPVP